MECQFDEKVERILPEVERRLMARHTTVKEIKTDFKNRERIQLHITLYSDHRGGYHFPYSISLSNFAEENIEEIVSNISWAIFRLESGVV